MIWIGIIFGLLGLLLTWLKGVNSLTTEQMRKLNGIIFRARQLEVTAVPLGCEPGGVEMTTMVPERAGISALPTDPQAMRGTIIGGIDGALGHTFLITGDNRRLMTGMRNYWAQADVVQLNTLIALLPQGEIHGP